jgi:hypothetical protein
MELIDKFTSLQSLHPSRQTGSQMRFANLFAIVDLPHLYNLIKIIFHFNKTLQIKVLNNNI